ALSARASFLRALAIVAVGSCLARPGSAQTGTEPRPRPRAAVRDTSHLPPREKARLLHLWAEEALADPSGESRARATRDLEQAIQLEPGNPDHWLALGRVHTLAGSDHNARDCFDRALRLDPRDPIAHLERGRSWKREWVRWLDSLSFDRATADFD